MFKKLLFTPFLIFFLIGIFYPTIKEDTKIFDYCYSLEKILSRNSIENRKNVSEKVKSISKDIAKFGVSKTRGFLINNMINQYKIYKNSQIIKILPNEFYCFAGYWLETVNPGTFESIFYTRNKKAINKFKDELDVILSDINSEYKVINKKFKNLF